MAVRVGINGFGRIGRSFTRALLARGGDAGVELAAVNDPMGDSHTVAFLLKHDSVGGTLANDIKGTDHGFSIDGREIQKLEVMDPAEIPWSDHDVDVVIESTGIFTAREKVAGHLGGSVGRVIISAPSGDADATICMGVNDEVYDASAHTVISNASCTTNCVAPMAKVLDESFGIERGYMTTIHAYTNDQQVLDLPHKDLRRAHAAAINLIPTTTGAALAIGLVLPHLKGKVDGISVRAPVPTGSITDFVVELRSEVTAESVNEAFAAAATSGPLAPYLTYSTEPLVSTAIVHTPASCTFDSQLTMANGTSAKVFGWYDNEWGYSCRLVDLVSKVL